MHPTLPGATPLRRLVSSGLRAAFCTVALGSFASFANAQAQSAGTDDEVVTLPEFTVSDTAVDRYRAADAISAVRVRAPLLETPSSITVLTREIMDDLSPTRLFDVTRYAAGVQEGRGIQFQDRMIIRGFEVTGQRTVDNFLQPGDADNINEIVIDRIEIAKGPNAILAPAGAPGGSLNVITKSPLYRTERSVTALVGLFDAQQLSFDMTGAISDGSPFAYRLVGAFQDTRRYWDEDARMRRKALAPMFSYKISDRTMLTVKFIAADFWAFREPLLIIHPAVNAQTDDPYLAGGLSRKSRNGIQPWSHVGTHTADLFALLTTSLNENISLRFAANGRYYFEDSTQEFLSTPNLNNRYNPATGELTQDTTWTIVDGQPVGAPSPFFNPGNIPHRGDKQATRRRTANIQADGVAKYNFEGFSSQTVAGVALSRQLAYGRGVTGDFAEGIDLSRPDREMIPVWRDTWAFYNVNQFTNWQAYINQRFGLLDDRLFVTGGILHYDTYTYSRNHATGAAANILDDAKNMWTASILYKVLPNFAVYYSRSTNSAPAIANNQPLWRDGEQDEIGFKTEFFDQRLSFNFSYFEISQTNVTVPNPARQTDPTAPEQIVQDLSNKGWEVELIGGLTENLSIIATYSDLEMRDSLGRRVRAVADRNASALLSYRVTQGPANGLSLTAGVSYSGSRAGDTPVNYMPAPFNNVVGQVSFYLKPYYSTVLGASYRWQEKYLFRLTIDNVLDDNGYIQQAGGRVSGTGITTAPGINVKFSTTISF